MGLTRLPLSPRQMLERALDKGSGIWDFCCEEKPKGVMWSAFSTSLTLRNQRAILSLKNREQDLFISGPLVPCPLLKRERKRKQRDKVFRASDNSQTHFPLCGIAHALLAFFQIHHPLAGSIFLNQLFSSLHKGACTH